MHLRRIIFPSFSAPLQMVSMRSQLTLAVHVLIAMAGAQLTIMEAYEVCVGWRMGDAVQVRSGGAADLLRGALLVASGRLYNMRMYAPYIKPRVLMRGPHKCRLPYMDSYRDIKEGAVSKHKRSFYECLIAAFPSASGGLDIRWAAGEDAVPERMPLAQWLAAHGDRAAQLEALVRCTVLDAGTPLSELLEAAQEPSCTPDANRLFPESAATILQCFLAQWLESPEEARLFLTKLYNTAEYNGLKLFSRRKAFVHRPEALKQALAVFNSRALQPLPRMLFADSDRPLTFCELSSSENLHGAAHSPEDAPRHWPAPECSTPSTWPSAASPEQPEHSCTAQHRLMKRHLPTDIADIPMCKSRCPAATISEAAHTTNSSELSRDCMFAAWQLMAALAYSPEHDCLSVHVLKQRMASACSGSPRQKVHPGLCTFIAQYGRAEQLTLEMWSAWCALAQRVCATADRALCHAGGLRAVIGMLAAMLGAPLSAELCLSGGASPGAWACDCLRWMLPGASHMFSSPGLLSTEPPAHGCDTLCVQVSWGAKSAVLRFSAGEAPGSIVCAIESTATTRSAAGSAAGAAAATAAHAVASPDPKAANATILEFLLGGSGQQCLAELPLHAQILSGPRISFSNTRLGLLRSLEAVLPSPTV